LQFLPDSILCIHVAGRELLLLLGQHCGRQQAQQSEQAEVSYESMHVRVAFLLDDAFRIAAT
jgi:hypothetical protein